MLESDSSYEARKENRGAPMDIWRLDFSVRNGSGRWLDHLIARFQIDSAWPECTNWDVPEARRFEQSIEWAVSIGHIQESGRNVVAPGQTLIRTKFFIVLRGNPQPQFAHWSMDFDFAAAPPPDTGSPVSAPPMSAEQDTVFWQSIVNSTNPADFEAYLNQFPQGVFLALAQNRLAALCASGSELPASNRLPDNADPPAALDSRRTDPSSRRGPQPTCGTQSEGAECWKELASHPGCHVWDDHYFADQTAAWNGGCSNALAEGSGTLRWARGDEETQSRGVLRNGKREGHWVQRYPDGEVQEGSYVDGKRHGQWVVRSLDGTTRTRTFVRGEEQ